MIITIRSGAEVSQLAQIAKTTAVPQNKSNIPVMQTTNLFTAYAAEHTKSEPKRRPSWTLAKEAFYTVFQKKTSTHIIGYKLRNSCPILIIFDTKIPHIIWDRMTA